MLFKKLLRTARSYKAQFISMLIMITLGVGIFLGFNMEWRTIEYDTSRFFENTNYADYRLYSAGGFTKEELEKIVAIDGVDAATRYLTVNLDVEGSKNKALAVDVSENFTVSTFVVISGNEYDPEGDGVWLSDKFAAANGISLGDEISLSFRNSAITGRVSGLIKSGEHMICVADNNQLMPDYNTFGFAYISPAKLKAAVEERLVSGYAEELIKNGMSAADAAKASKTMLSEEAKTEALDKIYAQINLISDMGKAELEEAVKAALGKTIMVTSKDDHIVYKEAMGEAEEGKTMGSILPVLFLAIAILTMVTTMHRIAAKEKQQIGTLKALGFKNRRILLHYTSYGLFIGLTGSAIGVGLGYLVCKAIMSENGMMGTYFDMPDWTAAMPVFCYPVIALTVALLTLISYLSVLKQLKGSAADALRPYTPKESKRALSNV